MVVKYFIKKSSGFLIVFILLILCFVLSAILTTNYKSYNNLWFYRNNTNLITLKHHDSSKIVIQEITGCENRPLDSYQGQRGDYWVLYNYIKASKRHYCYESITYTTQADYTFLDNVVPLIKRWNGPISIALYAPGSDFLSSLELIAYLRNCENTSSLIKEYITFHIFFDNQHFPDTSNQKTKTPLLYYYKDYYNCSNKSPFTKVNGKTYKNTSKLKYPINIARNIARITAQTHFIFPSDIELFPSPNLIEKFLAFVEHNRKLFEASSRKVFVLNAFEILQNETIPANKTALQAMLKSKKAEWFHKRICELCHKISNQSKWAELEEQNELIIFATIKRLGKLKKWEPFYIGTHLDPFFDERFTWEGRSDKMVQNFAMCLLDYDYIILDNAYLVHKPGIKEDDKIKNVDKKFIQSFNKIISNRITNEFNALYGNRKGCTIH